MKLHQKKLLKLLALNCRYRNKDIAKILRVSEDTVNYTKNEFLKNKIFNYSIFFDYRKLGYKSYHLLYSLKDIKSVNFDLLKKTEDITYINTFLGKYDLQIIILVKGNFRRKIKEINNILGDNILNFTSYKYEKELKLTHVLPEFDIELDLPKNKKDIVYDISKRILTAQDYISGYKLDLKDIKIIRSLLSNPVISYSEIQKSTRISRDTIKSRIKRYIKDNFLLSFSIFPNLKSFNYNTYCLLLNLNKLNYSKINQFIIEKKYVFYVEVISGRNKNLFFYIWTKDPNDFSEKVKDIKDYFKDDIKNLDLLFFDEYIHQLEFPSSLL